MIIIDKFEIIKYTFMNKRSEISKRFAIYNIDVKVRENKTKKSTVFGKKISFTFSII